MLPVDKKKYFDNNFNCQLTITVYLLEAIIFWTFAGDIKDSIGRSVLPGLHVADRDLQYALNSARIATNAGRPQRSSRVLDSHLPVTSPWQQQIRTCTRTKGEKKKINLVQHFVRVGFIGLFGASCLSSVEYHHRFSNFFAQRLLSLFLENLFILFLSLFILYPWHVVQHVWCAAKWGWWHIALTFLPVKLSVTDCAMRLYNQ